MTDDKNNRTPANGQKQDGKRPSKPIKDIPVQASADIFSSSEATHLLGLSDQTSLLNALDDERPDAEGSTASDTSLPLANQLRTTVFQADEAEREAQSLVTTHQDTATQILDQDALLKEAESLAGNGQITQMLDTLEEPNETIALNLRSSSNHRQNDFEDADEKTAFFNTHNESAQPIQKKPRKSKTASLVDPTPRRSLNQTPGGQESLSANRAPSPVARNSKSTPSAPKQRASKSRKKSTGSRKERSPRNVRSKNTHDSLDAKATPSAASPINAGIFAADASKVLDDVVDEVVKASWDGVPKDHQSQRAPARRPSRSKTLKRWIAVVVGFGLIIVIGLILGSGNEPNTEENSDNDRTRAAILDEVKRLGVRLPVSESARRIRPGTDFFILGRRDVFIIIDSVDRSKTVHAGSLWTTLKNSRNLSAIGTQLSGLDSWPAELNIGVDVSMSIAEVERLSTGLSRRGVQQINLLTESNQSGGLGELGLNVRTTMGSIPSMGALNVEMKNATVSLSLLRPQAKPSVIASLDTFEPRLEDKLNKAIESFAYENPRISRAFLQVPRGLRLNQIMDLAKPLVHDERIPRVTIIPYEIGKKPKDRE